jgi:L-ornithine Nalpha-acyltransferase
MSAQHIFTEREMRGGLSIRLARNDADIEASQRLRYKVFYQEMNARAGPEVTASHKDKDRFDSICDHLLVVKPEATPDGVHLEDGELVGTYRLLRQEVAEQHGGFYTANEFDIAPLIARNRNARFLELGRSCVLKAHRSKPVIELLWQGIWDYVRHHKLDVMFGCASLEGTDVGAHANALSFLAYHAHPLPQWHAKALKALLVDMKLKPDAAINHKQALHSLPPLIKGYLRLGCSIGEGAVIDWQFNTIDVLIILPVSQISARYFERFGKTA